jgi:Sel1 repeat
VTDVRVEVLPDTTAINGGRAIIRLTGLYDLPVDATYRIEPIDERINAFADPGWPSGDRKPNGSHLGHDGIELMIGPDVVEARLLAPGTPIMLSIPAAAIHKTLHWPDIPQRVGRSHIKLLPPPPPRPANAQAAQAVAPIRSLVEFGTDQTGQGHADVADTDLATDAPQDHWPGVDPTASFASEHADREVGPDPYADEPEPDHASPYAEMEPPDMRPYPVRIRPRYAPRPDLVRPFLIGVSLAGVFGLAAWFGFQHEITRYVQSVANSRLAEVSAITPVGPSAAATLTKARQDSETSPRGQAVSGVGVADALVRAEARLRQTPPDYAEARFWLRKAVGMSLGSKEMTWALTQLGTLYAVDGASQTDYARARMLWELAAAQGDAVALCFLGALHQKGLGGPADIGRAKSLYAQARKLGGCKDAQNPAQRPLPTPP